jgi:2-iminobutanoate/2-iminopropanoate deaminase
MSKGRLRLTPAQTLPTGGFSMDIERYQGRPGRPYVPVIKASPFVFTAGYTGFRPDGTVPENLDEQIRLIFDKARFNLEQAGSSMSHVVSATVYLTDQKRDRARFDELFAEAFKDHPPTRCCVEVQALSDPAKRIEIQFVAVVKDES